MQSDEQEIRRLIATWMTATKAGDLETVLGLMTEDVVFLRPGHPPMVGKPAFAASTQPAQGQSGQGQSGQAQSGQSQSSTGQSKQGVPQFDGRSEIQEIKVLGEWAFMWTQLTVIVTPPGGAAPMTRAGHTLTLLNKQNGKWLLARDANMLAPVSQPGA